nr:uncharacterized protein LOC107438514 isoform X2 [Parasteatoda tepidariorum]
MDDAMLKEILNNYSVSSYVTGETIQTAGNKHKDVNLISAGIVQLANISYETLQKMEELYGDLSFAMWKPTALEIAHIVLSQEETYTYWTDEKIKIRLDEGLFPDMENVESFEVHPVIADMVLVQGKIMDTTTDVIYTGPVYIPSDVRLLSLLDDPESRPRVVLILLRQEKYQYHSRTIDGWIDIKDISYRGLCLVHGMRKSTITSVET